MTMSAYSQALALRFLLANDDTDRTSEWGLALCTAPPDKTSFAEAVGNGYLRVPATFANAAVDDSITAAGTFHFSFNAPTTLYGFALYDAHSGGNVLCYDSAGPVVRGVGPDDGMTLSDLVCEIGNFEGVDPVSLHARNLILDYLYRGQGTPVPAVYLALSTDTPDPANNIANELAGDSAYQRQVVALTPTPNGSYQNSVPVTFSFANDATIKGACLHDNTVGGNMIFGNVLEGGSSTFSAGEQWIWPTGKLTVSLV